MRCEKQPTDSIEAKQEVIRLCYSDTICKGAIGPIALPLQTNVYVLHRLAKIQLLQYQSRSEAAILIL